MIFCLSGAHRVGKTTLMREVAKQTGLEPLELNIGALQREIGFDSRNQSYSMDHRLKVQEYVVKRVAEIFHQTEGRDVICDRSPIDLIAYTLVHATDSTTAEQHERIQKIIRRCSDIAKRHCLGILLVQPGIELKEENTTSGKCSAGFIEHLNTLCFGLLNSEPFMDHVPVFYVRRDKTELSERVQLTKGVISRSYTKSLERIKQESKGYSEFFVSSLSKS